MCPVARRRRGLRRDLNGSALPTLPQSVSRGARFSRLHWFATGTACPVARPPGGICLISPATGGFYIQASDGLVARPAAGYDYNSNWTPLLAGLSPAGMAASLAAPDPDVQISRIRFFRRELRSRRRSDGRSWICRSSVE